MVIFILQYREMSKKTNFTKLYFDKTFENLLYMNDNIPYMSVTTMYIIYLLKQSCFVKRILLFFSLKTYIKNKKKYIKFDDQ